MQGKPTVYLYNVLGVLGWILEDGATVLQVFLIEGERVVIDLLETRIPKLCLLQVDHEVSVDWATLNETYTAEWSVESVVSPNHRLQLIVQL